MLKRLFLFAILAVPVPAQLVSDIRDRLSGGDLATAEAVVEDYYRANGVNSEYAAGLGWVARGALMMHDQEEATAYLAKAKNVISELEKKQRAEDDENLRSALGSAIDVEAQLMAGQGKKADAVAFLQGEAEHWKKPYGLHARIVKNLNSLTLIGKPAPELPTEYRGKPLLLFLWADWCRIRGRRLRQSPR